VAPSLSSLPRTPLDRCRTHRPATRLECPCWREATAGGSGSGNTESKEVRSSLRLANSPGVDHKGATKPWNSVCTRMKDANVSCVDAISKTRTAIRLVYAGYIVAWFCFLFLVHTRSRPHRHVSFWVLVAFVVAAVYAVVVGFVLRSKLFTRSTDALPADLRKALALWRAAHIMGFTCAMNVCILGFVLKLLGSSWLVPGIFFGLSLGFLLLWRPRQFAVRGAQPA
jgi:hypothetical protein